MAKKNKTFKPRKDQAVLFKEYDFFRRSYEGGSAYRDGNYLIKHPREKTNDYNRRKEQASFVNFCSDVVDIYTSYLFREEPKREVKNKDQVIDTFMEDADLEGRDWAQVVQALSKMASYFGAMGVIVDKPKGAAGQSRGEELEAGVRPYVAAYAPTAIWDWTFEKGKDGIKKLTRLVLEEDNDGGPTQLMVWTTTGWELWQRGGTARSNSFKSIDEGEHSLEEIPFALLRNRDSFKRMAGISDIADIAPVNRRIYYLDSDALEIIDGTAFPILEGPAEAIEGTSGKSQESIIGVSSLLKRPDGPDEGFKWLEAPHTSLAQILAHRNSSIGDIKWMAKTGQGDAQKQQPASGVALELTFQQLNALLSDKAKNAEIFEKRVFFLINKYEDSDFGYTVEYSRKFGIRDLMHDLDTAITSKMVINSPTYVATIGKAFALKILPRDTPQETLDQIEKELESPAPLPGSEDDGEDDENNS